MREAVLSVAEKQSISDASDTMFFCHMKPLCYLRVTFDGKQKVSWKHLPMQNDLCVDDEGIVFVCSYVCTCVCLSFVHNVCT